MSESLYQLVLTHRQIEDLLMALIAAETQARYQRTDIARGADIDAYVDLQASIDRQCKEQEGEGVVTKLVRTKPKREGAG